jgi:hypothetical protein
VLGEQVVVLLAQPRREVEIGVQRADRKAVRGPDLLEQADLDRRSVAVHERHRHQYGLPGRALGPGGGVERVGHDARVRIQQW